MKPIEQKIIDFADDFFFHLSPSQVEERMVEFSKKQNILYQFFMLTYNEMSGVVTRDITSRMILAVDYCFSTYHVKFDTISIYTLKDFVKWQNERLEISERENSHIPLMTLVDYFKSIGDMEQDNLLIYFQTKRAICDELNLFNEDDESRFDLNMMTIGFLYQAELRKQTIVVN